MRLRDRPSWVASCGSGGSLDPGASSPDWMSSRMRAIALSVNDITCTPPGPPAAADREPNDRPSAPGRASQGSRSGAGGPHRAVVVGVLGQGGRADLRTQPGDGRCGVPAVEDAY